MGTENIDVQKEKPSKRKNLIKDSKLSVIVLMTFFLILGLSILLFLILNTKNLSNKENQGATQSSQASTSAKTKEGLDNLQTFKSYNKVLTRFSYDSSGYEPALEVFMKIPLSAITTTSEYEDELTIQEKDYTLSISSVPDSLNVPFDHTFVVTEIHNPSFEGKIFRVSYENYYLYTNGYDQTNWGGCTQHESISPVVSCLMPILGPFSITCRTSSEDGLAKCDQIIESLSYNNKFSHVYLPGFEITYNSQWKVAVQQFSDTGSKITTSGGQGVCERDCMALRLSKDAVSLEIFFRISLEDMQQLRCSNSTEFHNIGDNWFRIRDKFGFFYSYGKSQTNYFGAEINHLTTEYECEKYGDDPANIIEKYGEEWSCNSNTTYKICDSGHGVFLPEKSLVSTALGDEGVPIIVEKPRIIGDPDEKTLKEIDKIVTSIKFEKN